MEKFLEIKGMRKIVTAILSVLLLLLLARTVSELKRWRSIDDGAVTNMITVTGKGEAFAVADVATFTFTVDEKADTMTEAQKKSAEKNNAALKFLKDKGVDDKDIKTTAYSADPEYSYSQIMCIKYPCPQSNPQIIGFHVVQVTEVKVRDTAKAGDILQGVSALSVSNVGALGFTVSNEEDIKAEARALAIKDAKAKAKVLAKDLGVSLDRIMSFYEDQGSYPVMYSAKATRDMAAGSGTAPEVSLGQNKVTVNVTITYRID